MVSNVDIQIIFFLLDDLTFCKTHKGTARLILNGYIFWKNKTTKDTTWWLCGAFRDKRKPCPARCVTVNKMLKKMKGKHNHTPNVFFG